MTSAPKIVLKLGGSVLRTPKDMTLAVLEVERFLREGYVVVVVCSAFHGRTDELELLAASARLEGREFDVAETLSRGEIEAAQRLIWALRRSGLDPVLRTPSACGLEASGPVLEARDVEVGSMRLRDALGDHAVVVVPGFSAVDAQGRTVLLGRGGSDWTALLLADGLRRHGHSVRCRLVKDVDALYDRDPHAPLGTDRPLHRFRELRFEDVPNAPARPQDAIVQPRAVLFAADCGLPFEIAGWNGATGTLVGGPRTIAEPVDPERSAAPPLRIALLGAGTVGLAVAQALASIPGVELVSVLVRDPGKQRPGLPGALLTTDPARVLASEPDLVIELLGGIEPARALAERAIRSGASLISANKKLMDLHGVELGALARTHGVSIRYGAAVGGGVPMLETVARLRGEGIRSLRGVLNGTTNFVLDQLRSGQSFDEALAQARHEGLCESDPSSDLDGHDAAHKLQLLLRAMRTRSGEARVEIPTDALEPPTLGDTVPTQVAHFDDEGPRVVLEHLEPSDRLGQLKGAGNRLEITLSNGELVAIEGPGAGRGPTARAVLADLSSVLRTRATPIEAEVLR